MSRTKAQIQEAALRAFGGFEPGQDPDLDQLASDAFYEILRRHSNRLWPWSRIRGDEIALTEGESVVTLPARVGKIDERTVRIRKGTQRATLLGYLSPARFDNAVSDATREDRPTVFTTVEFMDTRKIQLYPVPNADDYVLILNHFRNLAYTQAGTLLTDNDPILAPSQFEELIVQGIVAKLAQHMNGPDDPRVGAFKLLEAEQIATMKQNEAVEDPQVRIRYGRSYKGAFRTGP